jgi:hypothetical protein
MATQEVTATLVVNFAAGAGGDVLIAEIDSREDGFNNGKTRFSAGDQPVFLIYKTDNVTIDSITPSGGLIQNVGVENIVFEETLTFAKERQATIAKPAQSGILDSFKWIGNDLGVPTLADPRTVSVPTEGVGVLKVTYTSQALVRRLTNITVPFFGENEFVVLIFIEGTAT